jgi:glutathione peroxidase
VKGDDIAPLYRWLTDKKIHPETGGDVRWNFQKYLVGSDGKVLKKFDPPVNPEGKEVVAVLEEALKKARSDAEAKTGD